MQEGTAVITAITQVVAALATSGWCVGIWMTCREGRIRERTWAHWKRGIRARLSRPEFRRAWEEIKTRLPEGFDRLRELESEMFPDG